MPGVRARSQQSPARWERLARPLLMTVTPIPASRPCNSPALLFRLHVASPAGRILHPRAPASGLARLQRSSSLTVSPS